MILKNDKLYSSYSQIDNYLQCPMKWYLDKVMKLKEDMPNKHLLYGLVIHEFLEELFNTKMVHEDIFKNKYNIKEATVEEYKNAIKKKLDNKNIPLVTEYERNEYYNQAFEMINYLYYVEDYFTKLLYNSEIIGTEVPFDLEIEIPSKKYFDENGDIIIIDTVHLVGSIDLVLRNETGIIAIDYKSSSKKFDKQKLKKNLQFPIYSLAIKQEFGEYPVENYYFFSKLQEYQKVLFTQELTPEQEAIMNKKNSKEIYSLPLDEATKAIKKVFNEMSTYQTDKNKPRPCPSPLCYWCEFGKHNNNICKGSSDWQPK